MLLAIDSGNTNAVFAVYAGDALRASWRISTNARRTADEYAIWLTQLLMLDGLKPADIDAAIIGNVVPDAMFHLVQLCQRYLKCEPLVIGRADCKIPVGVDVDMPARDVGADRIANSAAAGDRYKPPLIVVDFGTATNFDIVDRHGSYCGGVIAPGPNLALQALEMGAAQLPHVALVRPPAVVGRSTVPAMQSGVFWGYLGLIEGIIRRIRDERKEEMGVIATGGLASLFAGATTVIDTVDRDLTLWGLRLIYRHNSNR